MHDSQNEKAANLALIKRLIPNGDQLKGPQNRQAYDCLQVLRLPGRLDMQQTAAVLGFPPHDIPVLVAANLLQPLGKPAANAPKFFAACVVEQLCTRPEWLDKATLTISQYWRLKNERKSK